MAGKKTPEEVLKLIQIYSDAKIKILQTLREKEAKGNSTAYQKSLLRQVDVILEDLNKEVVSWGEKTVSKYYKEKLTGIAEELQREITASSFSKIHKPAIELLTENLIDNLTEANKFVGRKMKDTFRQVSLEVTAEKFAVGLSVKETKKRLIEEFLKNGITGFTDKAGRNWQLDTYAAMVANTTYGEVVNRATLNQAEEWNYDLVKILENNSSCPICAPLEGRVYSRTGKDKRFPLLDVAYSGDNLLIHPNCLHILVIYVPELSDTLERDIKFSNRPFEIDPRTKKKVDLYNKIQAGKRELRADRKQFEKFKLALGKDAPKTFSAFRNIKKNYPHKFDEYLEDYKLSGYRPARKEIPEKTGEIKHKFNIPGMDNAALQKLSKAHEELLKFGIKNNQEMLLICDFNGNTLMKHSDGLEGRVTATDEMIELLRASPKNSLIIAHNHPSSSPFSADDLGMFSNYKSISCGTIIGHNETMYYYSVEGKDFPPFAIKEAYNIGKKDTWQKYSDLVMSGQITEDEAHIAHCHEVMVNLSEDIGIKYERIKPNE